MFRLTLICTISLAAFAAFASAASTREAVRNTYRLFNRDTPESGILILPDLAFIRQSQIDENLNMTFIIHGHHGSAESTLNPHIKNRLLNNENVNVIVVDWSASANLGYDAAVSAVSSVATGLADFIDLCVEGDKVTLANIHLVGFNLGAHVAGYVGRRYFLRNPSLLIRRITGLDPSGSQWGSNSGRLRSTDATYVEVIHTDGDGIFANGIGTALGRVDFFANGGGNQPGCFSHSCSHDRAWQLFEASLEYNHLLGHRCDSMSQVRSNRCRGPTVPLGNNNLEKRAEGIYRINTKRTYPY